MTKSVIVADQRKAEQSHTSVSKNLADLIKQDLETQWPDDFFDLFGAWEGESLTRGEQGGLEQRLELSKKPQAL